jgi:hypothetical protein
MPILQVAVSALNQRFDPAGVRELAESGVDLGQPFGELARLLIGDDLPPGFDEFIEQMPIGLQRAIAAAAQTAVDRLLPVTFAWAPGYDWELSVWDVADTSQTHGGMTMLIRSRFPDDPRSSGGGPTSG